jgi:hypothetical protein
MLWGRMPSCSSVSVWPVTYYRDDAVSVLFVAGSADATAVDARIRAAALLMLADLYENRETVVTGDRAAFGPDTDVPDGRKPARAAPRQLGLTFEFLTKGTRHDSACDHCCERGVGIRSEGR